MVYRFLYLGSSYQGIYFRSRLQRRINPVFFIRSEWILIYSMWFVGNLLFGTKTKHAMKKDILYHSTYMRCLWGYLKKSQYLNLHLQPYIYKVNYYILSESLGISNWSSMRDCIFYSEGSCCGAYNYHSTIGYNFARSLTKLLLITGVCTMMVQIRNQQVLSHAWLTNRCYYNIFSNGKAFGS